MLHNSFLRAEFNLRMVPVRKAGAFVLRVYTAFSCRFIGSFTLPLCWLVGF